MRAFSDTLLPLYRHTPRRLVALLGLLLLSLAPAAAHANTFTVTNLNDRGDGSLRQAIADANATAGADTILFADGLTGTIALTSELPALSDDVMLAGPGAKVLTIARSAATGTPAFRILTIDAGAATPPTARISGLTIANGLIQSTTGNAAVTYYGGGVWSNKANVTFTDCAISGNAISLPGPGQSWLPPQPYTWPLGYGGGVCNYQGNMTLTRCTLSNNSVYAAGGGGGLDNAGGTLTLTGCTISGNLVYSSGYYSDYAPYNSNNAYGGGIWNSGALNLAGCTLANNSAVNYNVHESQVPADPFGESYRTVTTIVYVPGAGSSVYNAGTSGSTHVSLSQTLLANGSAGGTKNIVSDAGIVVESYGYNVCSDDTIPIDHVSNQTSVDPKLSPLGDFGGQTLTHVPLLGSPALDAGNPNYHGDPATDQRGQPRVFNGRVDVGAVERQAVELVAGDDSYSVKHDRTLRVTGSGVLTNDSGTAPLSAILLTQPTHGTLTFNADGSFVYTPNAGYGVSSGGGDSFTYAIQDGNGRTSNTATVSITVIANTFPTLTNSATATATAGLPWNFTATAADPDLPDDTLTYSLYGYYGGVPAGMTINATTGVITWTPQADGVFQFGIRVRDLYGSSVSSYMVFTLTVTVDPNAPIAVNDSYSVKHDQTLRVDAPGVLANDTGTAPFSAVLVSQPAHGTVTLNADGSFVYTPNADFGAVTNSADSFTYRGRDTEGRIGKAATATITIVPDAAPVLTSSLSATATAGLPWNFTATATDADLPDDTLTFALVNAPPGMTINATTGVITYTQKAEAVFPFDIKVTDRYGKSDQKTFMLTVQSDPNVSARLSITDVVVKRAGAHTVTVSFNVVNNGTGKATNLVISRATLGSWQSVANSAPINLGAGGRQAYTLTFSGVTPLPKVVYPLQIRGTYQAQNVAQSLFYGGSVVVP